MAKDDWFRNSDWSAEIEASFRAKLARAKDKAQYLRIQATYLAKREPDTALRLLEEYFQLGDHFDHAQAHVSRAEAYLSLGNLAGAVASYEAALERERVFPKLRTQAWVLLLMLIANRRMTQLYPRALELVDQHQQPEHLLFPMDRYRVHGARAIILNDLQRYAEARSSAELALAAAAKTQSGFSYHQTVGIVGTTDDDFGRDIRAIAGS